MPDFSPFALKALLGVAVLLLLVVLRRGAARGEAGARARRKLEWALVALALLGWSNFGAFHGKSPLAPAFVHHWEHFHYQLGSKYFPELGYDGLYAASVQAQREVTPKVQPEPRIRDLRDYSLLSTRVDEPFFREVRDRFSPERWRAFRRDHYAYQEALTRGAIAAIRTDHGYNPTPFWTFMARTATAWLPAGEGAWRFLGALDIAVLAIAFAVVGRTYGLTVLSLCLVVVGTGYGWRFYYNGGALLRFDWLAASLLGVCAL